METRVKGLGGLVYICMIVIEGGDDIVGSYTSTVQV